MRPQVHRLLIGFGDCDPAGIVYYPNVLAGSTMRPMR